MIVHNFPDGSVLYLERKNEYTPNEFLVITEFKDSKYTKIINIPDSIDAGDRYVNVEEIGEQAFANTDCKNIVLPSTIRSLHKGAFYNATMEELVIPAGITIIPESCFENANIGKISFASPKQIKEIGSGAFSDTRCLKEFVWPSGCKEIPSNCFFGSSIQKIEGINNVETIGSGAFADTFALKSITWPKKCKTIPSSCFWRSAITSVRGIENVEVIEKSAFQMTKGLTSFNWPLNCTKIPGGCFEDSVLRNITGTENVKIIENLAFEKCFIKDINFPKIEFIGGCSFLGTQLREATLGSSEVSSLWLCPLAFPTNAKIDVSKYQDVFVQYIKGTPVPLLVGSFDTDIRFEEIPN